MNTKSLLSLLLLGATTLASAEILARFNGEIEDEDKGTILGTNKALYNYRTVATVVGGVERDGDGDANDTICHIPWRSDLTPNHADFLTTSNTTHAASPMWGGVEWVAFNTNSAALSGSNKRFCLIELTEDSNHGYSEPLNYRCDFPKDASNKSLVDGAAYGVVLQELDHRAYLGTGSEFSLMIHSNDFGGPFTGRWVVEVDPGATGNSADYVHYISDETFSMAAKKTFTLRIEEGTTFRRFHPEDSLRFDPEAAGVAVFPPFDGVVGAGIYFDSGEIQAGVRSYLVRFCIRKMSIDVVGVRPTVVFVR